MTDCIAWEEARVNSIIARNILFRIIQSSNVGRT